MIVSDLIESGTEWIGMIQREWRSTKIKGSCYVIPSNVDKKTEDNEQPVKLCNYVDVYYNDFIKQDINFMEATANENEVIKFQLEESDVIITKDSEDPFDIAVPAIVKDKIENLLCGYHLAILRNYKNRLYGAFIFWCFKDLSIASQFHREATGITRWAISRRHIKNGILPLPPLPEQKLISAYLDRTTATIDKAVAVKRKQLENLEELKKSIIYKAVTKGLDDSVEMKDSGIEWIGKIPKGWKVKRIKDNFKLQSGENLTSEQIQNEGSFPVLGGNGLRGYFPEYNNDGEYLLIGRQGALCGNINYISGKFWATEHAIVCYPIRRYAIRWLEALLIIMNLNQYSNAAAQPGISVDTIKRLYIPVPGYKEQLNIAAYLDQKTSEIDTVLEKITLQIEKLEEYKKSLIHECVTGKRRITEADVQEAVYA